MGAKEAGNQNVGIREVELLGRPVCSDRGDSSVAAALPVEDRPEQARRVETWAAVPVDRPLGAHERDRVEVADEAVFGYRQVVARIGGFRCPRNPGAKVGMSHRTLLCQRLAPSVWPAPRTLRSQARAKPGQISFEHAPFPSRLVAHGAVPEPSAPFLPRSTPGDYRRGGGATVRRFCHITRSCGGGSMLTVPGGGCLR